MSDDSPRPPLDESLDDALDRLEWARKHFETLRVQIEPFEKRDTHRFSVEMDADVGEYVFYIHDLEPVNSDWGLVICDCIHSARVALDYLMVQLWSLTTGEDARTIDRPGFPIVTPGIPDPVEGDGQVTDAYAKARSDFASRWRKHREDALFSGYLTRIEELQPFNLGNPSIWKNNPYSPRYKGAVLAGPNPHPLPSALARLATLDNIAKHRVLHAAWLGIDSWGALGKGGIDWPAEFKARGSSTEIAPLTNDAEVGRVQFEAPLPFEWKPDQVQMKRAFPLQVAFDEPSIANGALEILSFCLWGVQSVLAIFHPVFANGDPPLPVTAIPHPG